MDYVKLDENGRSCLLEAPYKSAPAEGLHSFIESNEMKIYRSAAESRTTVRAKSGWVRLGWSSSS